jgi:hypothetical protein
MDRALLGLTPRKGSDWLKCVDTLRDQWGPIIFSEKKLPLYAVLNASGVYLHYNLEGKTAEIRPDILLIYKGKKPTYSNWVALKSESFAIGSSTNILYKIP